MLTAATWSSTTNTWSGSYRCAISMPTLPSSSNSSDESFEERIVAEFAGSVVAAWRIVAAHCNVSNFSSVESGHSSCVKFFPPAPDQWIFDNRSRLPPTCLGRGLWISLSGGRSLQSIGAQCPHDRHGEAYRWEVGEVAGNAGMILRLQSRSRRDESTRLTRSGNRGQNTIIARSKSWSGRPPMPTRVCQNSCSARRCTRPTR